MKKFIAIAGNMGIGKTTLTKKLAEHLNWQPYLEPFKQNPYLEDFYKDMQKWAYHSQMFFLGKRVEEYYNLLKEKKSVVQDRTFYENAEVFAKNLYRKGLINKRDWAVYQNFYRTYVSMLPAPDLVIYLRASTDMIMDRIEKRSRDFEKNIEREYVDELNDLYDEWISDFEGAQVLSISYDDLDLKNSNIDFQSFLDAIKDYIKEV